MDEEGLSGPGAMKWARRRFPQEFKAYQAAHAEQATKAG
jgi:hypothetical protein